MAVKTVDAATLKRWLDSGEAVLVDVREPSEHAAGRIARAALVPLGSVSAARVPEHAGRKLVIHCLKGGRGATACAKLLAEDPTLEVFNLEGGIEAWASRGYAVERQISARPRATHSVPSTRHPPG